MIATCPLLPFVCALPRSTDGDGRPVSRPERLAAECRRALPLWLLLSLVLASHVVLRHRRYGLPGAGIWGAFVLLGGVPGWLAWRWHRPWPTLLLCPACGLESPASRRACRRCELPLARRDRWRQRDRERPAVRRPAWRCMAWKEWRELAPGVLVALLAALYWATWRHGIGLLQPPALRPVSVLRGVALASAPTTTPLTSWVPFATALAPVAGMASLLVGLWQGWSDDRERMWPWLRTRAVAPHTLAAAKVLTGLAAVELLTLAPTLLLVAWALTPGCYAAPFGWWLPQRALLLGLATPWCWIAGWLISGRRARWCGTRLLPALGLGWAVAVALVVAFQETPGAAQWAVALLTVLAVVALVPWVAREASR